ncbi:MAG TPA: hypothetical protein VJ810_16690 [Blastocatellia bacterium]|nr:hypothetical protein [Blastocatellia bacterium]
MYTLASSDKNAQARTKPLWNFSGAIKQAKTVGAVVGLFGGIFATMSGAVFTVASWLVTNDGASQWLSTAGTVLFILTIPLFIFGAFCMDWVEKDKPYHSSKISRFMDTDDDDQ